MNKLKSVIASQLPFFVISFVIFITAATFGWERLHYGFNFTDEGYHMTEAWRLTVGDHLFQDKIRGAIDLSPLINSLFFRIWPDITLLGFRKLQYIFTIFSLLLFSIALYKTNKQYWYQPLVFSIFAFTGLEPLGLLKNLNYFSYQNLFITTHLSFFLLGLHQEPMLLRRAIFITAGFFLWLVSFTLLHLSLVLLSPLIFFYLFHRWKMDGLYFEFKDLLFLYLPILLGWMIFMGIFNVEYIHGVITNIQTMMSSRAHALPTFINMNWPVLERVSITTIFLVSFLYCLLRSSLLFLVISIFTFSLVMYLIIDTSFFSLLSRPHFEYFSRPVWFSSLIISVFGIFLLYFAFKIIKHRQFSKSDILATVLFIPCILLSISSTVFSDLGPLTIMHKSIPVIGGMSILLLSHRQITARSYLIKFLILLTLFAPFYYSTAWSAWRNTFFDFVPEQADVEIDEGFGKGIRTNPLYKDLYDWISANAELYTTKDDYIISYVLSPMVHMITKRRPALGETFLDFFDIPPAYFGTSISLMERDRREPKIAFIFDRELILIPLSLKDPKYIFLPPQLTFPSSDPISKYVATHMHLINVFKIQEGLYVRCYYKN